MKKLFLPLILLLLAACSGPKKFTVSMEGDLLGTQLLTVVYTLPSGDRAVLQPTAMDGRVQFEGSSDTPAQVEVFTTTGVLIATFEAKNGDKITLNLNVDQGSSPAPPASDTIKVTTFTAPEVIVERDSVETFPTAGVWVFTSTAEQRTPALLDTLRHYGKRGRDIYFGTSLEDWRYTTRRDSATWRQGLLPQGPVNLPAVTRTPLLIEADTAGTILRRIPL